MLPSEQDLSNLLGLLYDAAGDPVLWDSFLQQLTTVARSQAADLVMHDMRDHMHTISRNWGLDPVATRAYQEHYGPMDAFALKGSCLASGWVGTSESLCPPDELSATEFYNDFLVPYGCAHAMFALIENKQPRIANIAVLRPVRAAAFEDADLDLLRFLLPHIRRAFRLHFQMANLHKRSQNMQSAVDLLPNGMILLDDNGKILFMNRAAAQLVSKNDGLLATRAGLTAEQHGESSSLSHMIKQAVATSNGKGVAAGGTLLISRRTRRPLQVLISPIRPSMVQLSQGIGVVVFINDPCRTQRPADTLLRTLYGLTRAECRVALLLSDGRAPREIADTIGVTENTIRSQIKSIYNKTGVKRQSELIRLLLSQSWPFAPLTA